MITRRELITDALLTLLWPLLGSGRPANAAKAARLELGPSHAFSFDGLREQAQQLATQPYQPPVIRHAEALGQIDYDVHRQIRYRPEAALWARGEGPYPVQFFHLARLFRNRSGCMSCRLAAARGFFTPANFSPLATPPGLRRRCPTRSVLPAFES